MTGLAPIVSPSVMGLMWRTRCPLRRGRVARSPQGGLEDVARRSEVTEEYYWLHHDPAGDLLVVASDSDQITSRQILANHETAFDR